MNESDFIGNIKNRIFFTQLEYFLYIQKLRLVYNMIKFVGYIVEVIRM